MQASKLTSPDFTVEIVNPKYLDDVEEVKPIYWNFSENLLIEEKNDELYKDVTDVTDEY